MTDIEIYESNLLPFNILKRYGTKAQCRCPTHDDKHAHKKHIENIQDTDEFWEMVVNEGNAISKNTMSANLL